MDGTACLTKKRFPVKVFMKSLGVKWAEHTFVCGLTYEDKSDSQNQYIYSGWVNKITIE